jgi:lipopolysaccharide export system protein LptA
MMRLSLTVLAVAFILCAIAPGSAAPNPFAGSNKHNAKTPIDIAADTLEVLQEENKAIFTGHVVAIQGDVRLKSDKMVVHYAQKTADTGKGGAESGAIKKIDVTGNVFLSTPEETASGAAGVYDVDAQTIVLNENVVLTRGKNTLRGSNLVYDFASGKSKLTGGTTSVTKDATGKERVRALFVPEDKEQKQ